MYIYTHTHMFIYNGLYAEQARYRRAFEEAIVSGMDVHEAGRYASTPARYTAGIPLPQV